MLDRMAAEIGSTLKVIVAILKLILWQTGSQCRSERTGVMRQNRGFWGDHSSKSILDKLKASQI